MTAPTGDRRLYDDAGDPIRPADATDRPADAHPDAGRWEAPSAVADDDAAGHHEFVGLVATLQGAYVPEAAQAPLAAPVPPPPGYSRTSTGRVLADVDGALFESVWQDNTRLRRERDAALADAATERSARRDAQARLAQAETERGTLLAGFAGACERITELELTVKALGGLVAHAAGHDADHSDMEGAR